MAKESKKTNFAEAFNELEEIVRWFESSEVDLEEGLKKFERGLELAQKCRGRLKEVENKVTQIKAKFALPEAEGEAGEDDQARLL
jgi:exodeoxyribonuclease VII small subunit